MFFFGTGAELFRWKAKIEAAADVQDKLHTVAVTLAGLIDQTQDKKKVIAHRFYRLLNLVHVLLFHHLSRPLEYGGEDLINAKLVVSPQELAGIKKAGGLVPTPDMVDVETVISWIARDIKVGVVLCIGTASNLVWFVWQHVPPIQNNSPWVAMMHGNLLMTVTNLRSACHKFHSIADLQPPVSWALAMVSLYMHNDMLS